MDELRWFLLIVGLCIIAVIFVYGVWEEYRARRESGGAGLFGKTPDIDTAFDNLDQISSQAAPKKQARPGPSVQAPDPVPQSEPEPGLESPAEDDFEPVFEVTVDPEPDELDLKIDATTEQQPVVQGTEEKVVVLYISGGEQYMYSGRDLVAAVEAAGMHYGAHDIFHASADSGGNVAMFSAANMLEPGSFDLERLDEIASPGLALFMQLPGPYDGLEAFEQMLAAGRQIADQLGAQLLDGRRSSLTQQAVEHIREELLEYRRRAHLAARKQSR